MCLQSAQVQDLVHSPICTLNLWRTSEEINSLSGKIMSLHTVKGQSPGTELKPHPCISQLHQRAGKRENGLSVILYSRSTSQLLHCCAWQLLITLPNPPGVSFCCYSLTNKAERHWRSGALVRITVTPLQIFCILVIKEVKGTGPCQEVSCCCSKITCASNLPCL